MNKLIQTYILPGIYKFTFSIAWGPIIGAGITALGSMYTNKKNREMQYDMARNGLGWKIEQGQKYGIHPLAAIGAAPTPMPTIPMQNPLSGMSSALTNNTGRDAIDEELRRHALNAARDEASDRLYRNYLVVPVNYKGKQLWVFNPRFQSYGTFAQAITFAENADIAKKALMDMIDETSKSMLPSLKKKFNIFK